MQWFVNKKGSICSLPNVDVIITTFRPSRLAESHNDKIILLTGRKQCQSIRDFSNVQGKRWLAGII